MKRISLCAIGSALLLTCLPFAARVEAQIYPLRLSSGAVETAPYNSAGLVFADVGGSSYRGSAVVARDSRLLYTCAHVLYDEGSWATSFEFARRWHSSTAPSEAQTVAVRGYRYYSTYSGGSLPSDFAVDFAIGYGTASTNFGPAVGYYTDGGIPLRSSSTSKLILGYPARRDYDYVRGYYYQHRTGPFTLAMRQSSNSYHTLSGASTGGGNSGGPVLAYSSGQYYLAGILVSGSRTTLGVHALNASADTMAKNALASLTAKTSGTTRTASNTTALTLTDGTITYSKRTLSLSKMPASMTAVKFNLRITTPFRGDLDVYLRSPAGRVRWVNKHSATQSGTNLSVSGANYSSSFSGTNPNGTWTIYMRDYYLRDRASFKSTSITATSR